VRADFLPLGLALLTLASLGRVCGNGFIDFDDPRYVTDNPHVRAGLTLPGLRWALTAFHAYNWHPLTWISLQADAALFGPRPWGYHLTNLLLHAAAVLALYAALRRMTGRRWRSAAVAALFAVHPLHVESVAWVAERKDVLSGLFWMLTLWAYARYAEKPGAGRYGLVVLLTGLGLTAKPMLVTLPLVLLLLDYWPLRRLRVEGVPPPEASAPAFAPAEVRRLLLEKVPLLVLAVACSAATVRAQERIIQDWSEFSPAARVANAAVTCVTYLAQAVWPRNLAFFYPHAGDSLPAWKVAGAALLLVGVSALAVWSARRRPYLLVGWLWYLGTLVPVLGLVQVGLQGHADRYTYIPLVGIFLLLAWGVPEVLARWEVSPALTAAGTVVVVAGLGVAAWFQSGYWVDSPTLWRHTLEATGDNFMAHFQLGIHQMKRGNIATAQKHFAESVRLQPRMGQSHAALARTYSLQEGRQEEAMRSYQEALRLDPGLVEAHYDLGTLYDRQGNLEQAAHHYRQAVDLQPDHVPAHNNLGAACVRLGNWEEAVTQYRAALDLSPNSFGIRVNLCLAYIRMGRLEEAGRECEEALRRLGTADGGPTAQADGADVLGLVRERQGRWDEALAAYRRAVEEAPGTPRFRCHLAHALFAKGEKAAAAREYQEALRLEPGWPDQAIRQARALATDPEAAHRDGPATLQLALQACEATDPPSPEYLDTLAAAYAEVGRFAEAVEAAQRALDGAVAVRPGLAPAIRERIQLYQDHKPWREARKSSQ
jgi:tetratricopeptide (TPR) repeat protein